MINVVRFISISILSFSEIFVCSRFYNAKIGFKNIFFYFSIILMAIFGLLNYFYISAFIRMVFITIVLAICNWFIFKRKFNEIIISTIFTQLLLTIADIICALLLVIFFGSNLSFIKSDIFDSFFGNVLVSGIFVMISFIPFVKKIYLKLIDLTNNMNFKKLLKWFLLIIFSINILMALIYYKMDSLFVIIINSFLILIYSFIIYKTLNEKNNNIMIKAQNDSLMESLSEYENMLDRQRVDNHENKNQLLIIKNMINKNDKDVIKYIDTVVKDQKEDDEILYTKVKKIPSGGLQGIIYQKMLVMKDKNILFNLDVSRDIRKINMDNFSMNNNYKLCKIIGVFLDNAIEESVNLTDRIITISLYEEDSDLVIEVSNKFEGKINLDVLDDEGFTTKGDGHGYGLSLVKKIVSESDVFVNERQVNNNIFKQIIKVDLG